MGGYEPVLLSNVGVEGSRTLAVYRARGGYQAARRAVTTMSPQQVVDLVKASDLRGRGGAGFRVGVKWSLLPPGRETTYLCVNFDESEPGTFNNRYLVDHDPHQLLEGMVIAAHATQARTAYVYLRAEFCETFHVLQRAIDEAYAAGLLGRGLFGTSMSLDCHIHRGAGAYVCGEETGLIESLEGKRGWPRIKPPYPAVSGVFGRPTVVNNVESLCCVAHIIARGSDWFLSLGPAGSSGPKLYTVSGPVNRPGCYEAPLGLSVRELVFGDAYARGMIGNRKVKGVIPGGLSVGILSADELDCRLDFDDPQRYGLLGLGTAGAIIINEDTDMRDVLVNVARFYARESCGQCTQCREQTDWLHKIARRIAAGAGRIEDLDLMQSLTRTMGMMDGQSICGLPDGANYAIRTIVSKYRAEFERHIQAQRPGSVEETLSGNNRSVYRLPVLAQEAANRKW
ncbi:MAG: NADH-quinone oxidoreductase subunit NuoF [Phycisphaerae bacterium]|nr:NADH-quinone oxidoreductase subunit NuoF [Phycisphaerae bacterium]